MATMNRNVNLEEVNSDAFMGITFLNYQSGVQKAIFFGSVIASIAWALFGTFALHISNSILMVGIIAPLVPGVLFGCNFNQDLSLFNYLKILVFKPREVYLSKPTESYEQIREMALKMEKCDKVRMSEQSPEMRRRLLLKMGVGALAFIAFIIIIRIVIGATREEVPMHHVIGG